MPIQESGENYLESILKLSETKDGVHAIDVVNDLGFSKASVSVMLKKLKDDGFITIDNDNHLHLTESGLLIAETIYERHKILTDILIKLGVDSVTAEDDACKLEHDLTPKSFAAIKDYYLKNIK